jgi:polyhydroxyalkanoate synthesis regulator phasin
MIFAGKNIVRQNFIARVGEEKAIELDQFLTKANSLFIDESGGRFSTYNYTDARNITKYMFLKKVAHGGDRSVASSILQNLMLSGREFAHSTDDNFRQTFIDDLVSAGEVKNARARQLTDALAEDLLRAAGTFDEDRRLVSNIGQIDPQTGSILQQLAGQSEASAVNHAKLLARRMVFSGAMAEMFKDTPGMMPGEGIAKNLSTVIGRLFKGQNIDPTEFDPYATAAQQISDIQGMQGDQAAVDVINQENMDARSEAIRARRNSMARRMMEDAADAAELGTSKPGTVPNSSYKNALISGEFFAKISQMKYFKPAAAVVGGLAGIEVIRSAVDRFSPGNVPATGYNSANTMPPPPMISSPQDPTFARDAIPNTNIARVAKHHGQRSSVNISGKMDRPVDFRGITNNISLNNGYVPNIQGSFRSSLSDTMSQAEMAQFVGDRMGSSF